MRQHQQLRHAINLDPYTIIQSTPHRATNVSSIHASQKAVKKRLYLYESPQTPRSESSQSNTLSFVILCAKILALSILIGAPFMIVLTMAQHLM